MISLEHQSYVHLSKGEMGVSTTSLFHTGREGGSREGGGGNRKSILFDLDGKMDSNKASSYHLPSQIPLLP